MNQEILMLSVTAASIGFLHTLMGPDHYLPFIMMSKSGQWSLPKTMWVTLVCGIGHVASSVVLGVVGITLGIAVSKLEAFEAYRANWAAWALILFGFLYLLWGVYQAIRNQPHRHVHMHDGGKVHVHTHMHQDTHTHKHNRDNPKKYTPWVLFTIFVLGPCEPLIPILMYPAARNSVTGLVIVSIIFSFITIMTMMTIVWIGTVSSHKLLGSHMERYIHVVSGAAIFLCGIAIQFLGL